VTFWFSARVALFQAIGALGLRSGDRVALPAFCCGSEVDPFLHAGLTPRFFRVTGSLDPEPESFKAALEGSVAALAIHYLGFAADLEVARDACRAAGVPLIEDCAHALYSKDSTDWLGSRADVAIFSVSKTLPVPDGGALVTNMQTRSSLRQGSLPPRRLVEKRTRSLLTRHLQAHPFRPVSWVAHLPSATKKRLGLAPSEPNRSTEAGLAEVIRFDPKLDDAQMSARSLRLLVQTSHGRARSARRRNYELLLEAVRGIRGLEPLFPNLHEGTCPLALPVAVSDPDSFRRRLAAGPGLGVKQMWPWFHPSADWDDFPFEADLKRSLFILPVHQSLQSSEIDRLIATMRSWSRS
jgi:dTDP-4-amino-4,6-dideoxygalactose transaminase